MKHADIQTLNAAGLITGKQRDKIMERFVASQNEILKLNQK